MLIKLQFLVGKFSRVLRIWNLCEKIKVFKYRATSGFADILPVNYFLKFLIRNLASAGNFAFHVFDISSYMDYLCLCFC